MPKDKDKVIQVSFPDHKHDDLASKLLETINNFTEHNYITYSTVIGILEQVKHKYILDSRD